MLVSYQWLKDYVDLQMGPEELAEKLTMSGIEVESVSSFNPGITNTVVGKVLSVKKHPEADKLFIAQVDIKDEISQIVAGIDNFQAGDLVPVAKPGAVLPGGFKIKKSKLRGVTSNGMLCSAQELGLELAHDYGILVLDQDYPVGMDIAAALGLDDWILELGLTPNRSDCLGLLGVAYEVSAVTGAPLKNEFPELSTAKEGIQDLVEVTIIDEDLCSRYSARIVKNVTIKPSPLWMQKRLLAVGIRPINNIVDVTNYIMWECNQPLHGFDYDRIKDQKIIVRKADAGEVLVTLDEQERKLDESMLVITDPSGPVALAGVMGGLSTEITEQTRTVLIEAACFEPTTIRRTSRNLGLRSESSLRFERGTDPEGTIRAASRAAQLMAQLSSGQVVNGVVDEYPIPAAAQVIPLRRDRARKIIGLDISDQKIEGIMKGLYFETEESGNLLNVIVPTRRPDITREVDLVEEIARIYGYEHIETSLPRGVITQGRKTREQKLEGLAKKLLTSFGLYEAITYSFIHPRQYDDLMLDTNDPLRNVVKVYNPLSEEQSVMRTTLLGNLLNAVKYNANRNINDIRLFELGAVFIPTESSLETLPQERETLALVLAGDWGRENWCQKPEQVDFYDLKGILELFVQKMGLKNCSFTPVSHSTFHPGRAAEILIDGEKLGVLGEVHAEVMSRFDLEGKVYAAEIDFSRILKYANIHIHFNSLPKYPAVLRDIAVVVKNTISSDRISREILDTAGELAEGLTLFDVYQGEQIPSGYRSLAYSIVYRSRDKTLTDKEINDLHQKVIDSLVKKFEAHIRE